MRLSLIITTYNWPEALRKVLDSVALQSIAPFEVIIADDGSDDVTRKLVEEYQSKLDCSLLHSWQEDKGYRLALSRNRGINMSSGDYIVFIDGDTILERHFIHDHMLAAEKGVFVQGRRAYLTEKTSKRLLGNEQMPHSLTSGIEHRDQALRLPFLPIKFRQTYKYSLNRGMGGHCAFWRNDAIKVNGYNNDFEGWGPEDLEFLQRMFFSGLICKKLRFTAACYHIYHNVNTKGFLKECVAIYNQTMQKKESFCERGINNASSSK
ncbi:glycosyltransferase family 2 protein [Shewanella marinintestina]|uniref:glycosyltransferase family 2 protein n=1 Tax=Shewanella marinintestina TaxID=190305 RepID=UPI0020105306|nr:glycosyltransferase family 2 protein [Shewanella marinintestina]MCL1147764.1 glycosyltransferase family 2 protein [Shewanella marinintestina]